MAAVLDRLPGLPPAFRRPLDAARGNPAARAVAGALVALVVWGVLAAVLPHGAPAGIIVQGAILGAVNALVSLSVVLVYRANRVINFAAADMGAVAAVLAIELHIKTGVNYFVSIATGLVAAALIGAVVEFAILRRFARAPRLIVAVATIGLAQILNGASVLIPIKWSSGQNSGTFTTPFNVHFQIWPVLFNGNYVAALVVVPAVLVALTWFFRYTSYGVAIRAAADNGDRAMLLGVPVRRLSTVVWTITGVLSALAALLRVPIQGFASFSSVSSSGTELLLLTFAAFVIAGMTSMPVAVMATVALGVVDQLGSWTFQNAGPDDLLLLIVILATLLLKRDRLSRAVETGISTWQLIKPVRAIPPELSRFWQVRLGSSAVRLGILAFAATLPLWMSDAHTQLTSIILLYAMVAVALAILTGWAGHISLGHIAFMGLGAAVTGNLVAQHGWDFFLALAVGTAVSGVCALILGIPALRISGPFLAVVTLGLAVTAQNYFFLQKYFPWLIPQNELSRVPLFGRIAVGTDAQYYMLSLVALAVALAAGRSLRSSHAGRAIVAANDNRLATQSFAINTARLHLSAFVVSGAIAGLAGGLWVVLEQGFTPGSFTAEDGINFFLMVVIGGLGSLPGAVIGAVYVYGVQYLLPGGSWSLLATGAGVLVVLMFFPGGVGELVFRGRDALLRKFAERHAVLVPSLVADTRQAPVSRAPRPAPIEAQELAREEEELLALVGEGASSAGRRA
ncbi:MAG TPA: ABC transporter permease [Acidimicrobiales bacterium]|nr:ABC transporter permease [Acidimicrobiales bacterium]